MKLGALLCSMLLALAAGPVLAADEPAKPKTAQPKSDAKEATQVADTKAKGAQAMDPKAVEEVMIKLASPGPPHERLKQLEGQWDAVVKSYYTQPAEETKATSTVHMIMEGRYYQEDVSGTAMGRPFSGMSITGYDNILDKYVSIWVDNMGTGIMTSEGVAEQGGKVINWTAQGSDPMTRKAAKYRMVTRFVDADKYTFEMYGAGQDGKEMKMMEISYTRKKV